MKINSRILSIPPYISTSWENVVSIQVDGGNLIISLREGKTVTISNLPKPVIDGIFAAHSEFLEHPQIRTTPPASQGLFHVNIPTTGTPIPVMENVSGMLQHDPNQKDAPPLPLEMLTKIAGVSKALGLDKEPFQLPSGEPHCNCPFCQVSRAMSGQKEPLAEAPQVETEITDADLKFREWDIKQIGDKLYDVTAVTDNSLHYQVYLGQPIGCTCGKNNCEHIIAVLNS